MGAWIGTLGRLMKLDGVSSHQVDDWDGTSFQRTLEGKTVAQVKAKRGREWKLSIGVGTPASLAAIQALQSGEFGNGPFVFVPPLAPVTNMLMPEVSTCGPAAVQHPAVSVAGPAQLPDGTWVGRSLLNSDTTIQIWFGPSTIPIIPGQIVTASAYVRGTGCQITVQFLDSTGVVLGTTDSATGVVGALSRLSATATAPDASASCRVLARNTIQAARPALTWTDSLFDWGIGAGCDKAKPFGFSTSLILALSEKNYGRYSSLGFSIQEVG